VTGSAPAARYWLEHAVLPGGVADGVVVEVDDGRFSAVAPGPPDGAERLTGLTLPGLANCHSHAFHRALRARTQTGRGSFWTWRTQMYAVAGRLDPDTYRELARAVYAEMVAAGITAVGEFHYLHHQPDGTPYDEPNVMGLALAEAARDAGIRLTLLDTCYLTAGIGEDVDGVQRRFSDGDAAAWQERVDELADRDGLRVGAAVHSVRAVPPAGMRLVADWADRFETPLHAHVSEQVAENEQCLAAYGRTPVEVLAEAAVLGERSTVVHATHLADRDVELLAGTHACLCPTTERDLGDGIGPGRVLHAVGSPLTLGSDSHAVIDLFEEMRAVELDERLATRQRGHWPAGELLAAATGTGQRSLGFGDAGRIAVGARADLVTLDLGSPRTAGCGATEETAVFAATAADVRSVVVDGVRREVEPAKVGAELARVVSRLWEDR
jgi:formiminoglutamate deiminase